MKLEINGRVVEVDDSFKNLSPEDQNKTVDEIASSFNKQPEPDADKLALMGAPALTAAAYSTPTGAQQAGKVIGSAVAPYVKEVAKGYIKQPMVAAADAILATGGLPPIVGPIKGYVDRAQALKEGAIAASKELSMGSPTVSPVQGIPTTTTMGPYMDMYRAATPEVQQKLSDIWREGGGNNGVKQFLNSAEGQALQKSSPEFAKRASMFMEATPSLLQQAGRMVKPLAVGAARVAGPVGTAMQVAEAMPYMEQSQIGQRTRTGEVGQLMRGSRNMMLNQPTAQPLSPVEAENLLGSGNRRMMDIYGGEEALRMAVRRKAAQKVLGQ